mmetsp:Transcript_11695/g.27395  ORF Transcript_11695/g.27395 Transcript_11695/m.27395 type:complete len:219 (+) Transcript_11695:300-956(+)
MATPLLVSLLLQPNAETKRRRLFLVKRNEIIANGSGRMRMSGVSTKKHKRKQNQNPESTVEGKKKKPPKFLKPLKKCKCTCKKYVETKQTDDDGCPLVTEQQFLLGFSPEFECEQPKRDCVYSYVYSGCTFDELECVPFDVCECMGASWNCYHFDPIPCEQEETRPPRTLDDGDRQLVEGGLPTSGDPCDPDAPLPKAHRATGDDNPWGPGEEDGLQI